MPERPIADQSSAGATTAEEGPRTEAGTLSAVRNALRGALLPVFVAEHAVRNTRIDRQKHEVAELDEAPPPEGSRPNLQGRSSGVGPLVMRSFRVEIRDATVPAEELVDRLRADPNRFCSSLVAGFVREDSHAQGLGEGEELVVEIPGPWNGPVVVEPSSEGLMLATLKGHMEAGHIRFRTVPGSSKDNYTFEIRSWARAGDQAFKVLHLVLPVGRELQTAMWCAMCERAVAESGGTRSGPITVLTETLAGSERNDGTHGEP